MAMTANVASTIAAPLIAGEQPAASGTSTDCQRLFAGAGSAADSLAPTATPSEEGSSKCESVASETAADGADAFLNDVFEDSEDDEEDMKQGTPSKSARRRLRRKRQRDAIRAAALQRSLEEVGVDRSGRDAANKVVTLGDLGLEVCCTPQAASRCQTTPSNGQWSAFASQQQNITQPQDASLLPGGYRRVPAPINPLAPPQSPHFFPHSSSHSTMTTPFHGASPQHGCASTTTASTYVPMTPSCASTPSSLCQKAPGAALEVIGTSPCNGAVIRGDASCRAPTLNMMPGNAMSPLSCRMPQQQQQQSPGMMVPMQSFQGTPGCTPMATASCGRPPMMPATPGTPYAPPAFAASVPRPWFAAAPTTPLPATPPAATEVSLPIMQQQPALGGVPAPVPQTAAPTDALKLLLLGGAGGSQSLLTATPEEVQARLQAARPEVYED